MWWLIIVELAVTLLITLAACRFYLHMLQLESYQLDGYMRWLKREKNRQFGWTLNAGLIASIAAIILPVLLSLFGTGEIKRSTITASLLSTAFFAIYSALMIVKDFKTRQKKKMKFTGRMIRLTVTLALVIAAALGLLFLIFRRESAGLVLMWIPPFAVIILAPWLTWLAARCIQPLEEAFHRRFFRMAQKKLASRKNLIKIGITGSYGKTSTKFCLQAILSVKYNVYAPKSSINTPMGLSKVINEDLTDAHQVFIAEMGARHVGDIRELVELVHPRYGVLTSVGPQHLETFGDVKTVANTKFELIEGLPRNGVGIFAADDGEVDKLYERAKCDKRRVGISETGMLNLRAENIQSGPFGSRFTLIADDGERVDCETKLLGRHNISNLVVCCQVARELGMTMAEIAEGVARVQPVEHRLQLLPGAMNVIDDAFNSNPVGAKRALSVLKEFPGRHLIITPGFVELGENEKEFNYQLGKQIADACDAAILVGPKHTAPIKKGLLDSGFRPDDIKVVRTLEEATALIHTFVGNGDTVLFENDLPDNYTE